VRTLASPLHELQYILLAKVLKVIYFDEKDLGICLGSVPTFENAIYHTRSLPTPMLCLAPLVKLRVRNVFVFTFKQDVLQDVAE
jgi:hypothetical protein